MDKFRRSAIVVLLGAGLGLFATPGTAADKTITLGFAQIGAESEWRTANSESIKSSAKEYGINLKFSDAQQKQENQIKAIRSYIAQKVDVIAFSPVVETVKDVVAGKKVPKRIVTKEGVFPADVAAKEFPNRKY